MTDIVRKIASGFIQKFSSLPDAEADLLATTARPDRMDDVIEQGEGAIDYSAWMALGGTILRDHDNRQPVANAIRANATPAGFTMRIRFPDWGVSDIADRTRREVKAGLLTGVSIGFKPLDYELRNPNKPYSGLRFKEIEILEVSLTSVPANADAMVIGKSYSSAYRQFESAHRSPSTMDYNGTLAERQYQLAWDHPEFVRDAALAVADSSTREGRAAIVRAHRRYAQRMGW